MMPAVCEESLLDQQVPETTMSHYISGDYGDVSMETRKYQMSFSALNNDPFLSHMNCMKVESGLASQSTFTEEYCILDLDKPFDSDLSLYEVSSMSKDWKFYNGGSFCNYPTDICGEVMEASSGNEVTECSLDESFEQVQTIILDEVNKEIRHVCDTLNISQDPTQWSSHQVQRWCVWTLQQYKQPVVDLHNFVLDGTSLCMLTEDCFRARSPRIGSTLYTQLDIWRNAFHMSAVPESNFQSMSPPEYTSSPRLHALQPPPAYSSSLSLNSHPPPAYTSSSTYSSLPSSSPLSIPTSVMSLSQTSVRSPVPSEDSLDSSFDSEVMSPLRTDGSGSETEGPRCQIQLWQFLKELLGNAESHGNCIRWIDQSQGIFKIEDSSRVAFLWGRRKNRPAMNYDKLSRSIRQYYKKGIIKKTEHSKRLVYQFCPRYNS